MSKLLVANFKSNYTLDKVLKLIDNIDSKNIGNNIIICPSNIYLNLFINKKYVVGIQDISQFNEGAYTGLVAASQAKSIGVKYAIIGHYETRNIFHENYDIVREKINRCLENNIKVFLCISNLNELISLNEIDDLSNIVIVYEPILAIGTNRLPSVNEIIDYIKLIKNKLYTEYNINLKVLYGGSIDEENIKNIINLDEIDGVMISSSILNEEKFFKIMEVIDKQ